MIQSTLHYPLQYLPIVLHDLGCLAHLFSFLPLSINHNDNKNSDDNYNDNSKDNNDGIDNISNR